MSSRQTSTHLCSPRREAWHLSRQASGREAEQQTHEVGSDGVAASASELCTVAHHSALCARYAQEKIAVIWGPEQACEGHSGGEEDALITQNPIPLFVNLLRDT